MLSEVHELPKIYHRLRVAAIYLARVFISVEVTRARCRVKLPEGGWLPVDWVRLIRYIVYQIK